MLAYNQGQIQGKRNRFYQGNHHLATNQQGLGDQPIHPLQMPKLKGFSKLPSHL
jgi:hypothetical protein